MEQYLITPWDTRGGSEPAPVDWDMHVPPEIDAIAEQVMQQYDMTVTSRTLITSKPDKGGAIWRIDTNKGLRSLKLLHRNPERSLFSVGLQEYVVQQGARVPALIPAKDGKLFVEMGGKLWIVTDWIALNPATKVDLVGAQELCYGLGEFHRHSKGYVPPFGAKNSSRLYRWPNYYQKVAKKIGWMREMAKAYRETTASASILAVVDQYERQALEALERLRASAYPRMAAMGEPHWGLVHQDYGWSNGQNGPGGLWVIDLDGVSYDLPFRDLRKLITSTMDDMGVWDLTWMRGMIDAYHAANPLDAESYEVLLIDMSVPNEFYKHLKEMFFDPVTFLNTEAEAILQRVVATDQSKAQALAELAADKEKYKPGDYEQKVVAAEPRRVPSESTWDQKSWGLQSQPPADTITVQKRPSRVTLDPARETASKTKSKTKSKTASKTAAKTESNKVAKASAEKVKPAKLITVDIPKTGSNSTDRDSTREKPSVRQRKVTTTTLIDLLPYFSEEQTKRTPKRTTSAKKQVTSASKPKPQVLKKKTGAKVKKAVTKVASVGKGKTKPAKAVRKTAALGTKPGKRTAATGTQTRKAAQPKRTHSYAKVPAPSKKVNKQAVKKQSSKKGVKTKGMR